MSALLGNIVLALVWAAITGFTPGGLLWGFLLGYVLLWLSPTVSRHSRYFLKVGQLAGFIAYFSKELAIATLRISYDVLTPRHRMRAAVLALPLEVRTPVEITLLSLVVSLTPGTLVLDVSADRRTLYIHAMYAANPDEVRHGIKQGFERRILELLR